MSDPRETLRALCEHSPHNPVPKGKYCLSCDGIEALALVDNLVRAAQAVAHSWGNGFDPIYEGGQTFTVGGDFVSLRRLKELDDALTAFVAGRKDTAA